VTRITYLVKSDMYFIAILLVAMASIAVGAFLVRIAYYAVIIAYCVAIASRAQTLENKIIANLRMANQVVDVGELVKTQQRTSLIATSSATAMDAIWLYDGDIVQAYLTEKGDSLESTTPPYGEDFVEWICRRIVNGDTRRLVGPGETSEWMWRYGSDGVRELLGSCCVQCLDLRVKLVFTDTTLRVRRSGKERRKKGDAAH